MVLRHTATREGRLLSFLRREMGLSSGLVKRLKWQEALRVNGRLAHTDLRLVPGDEIAVTIEEAMRDIPAEEGPLSILYEDEAIIALDKPAGILMHPTFHRLEGTLANRLLGYYRRTGQPSAVHLVNRLDRDTFGVVLIAKNAHIHALLCGAMQAGQIEKTYQAVVYGAPAQDAGEMRWPIARVDAQSLLRCVRGDGKAAHTRYAVTQRGTACSLLRLCPLTGRTHQLRVHCAHAGYPILGDAQYGTEASLAHARAVGAEGQQLCAVRLAFDHPLDGRRMAVASQRNKGMIQYISEDTI